MLKKYRRFTAGNLRSIIIIGILAKSNQLKDFVTNAPDYGYILKKQFILINEDESDFKIEECINYVIS